MTTEKVIQRIVTICVVLLWYNQFLFAQSEIQPLQFEQDSIRFKKYHLYDDLSNFPHPGMVENRFFKTASPELDNFQPIFQFRKKQLPKTFLVSFNHFETVMPGMGTIELFANQFIWNPGKKVTVDFGTGLAIQNTILNPYVPNYQLIFRASVEYFFNDLLSAYLYGQFISKPLNKPDTYFDPFISNNPLFLQNEIGAGLKANFNKTHIGLEIYSMPGQDFKSARLKPTNSRITIGF